MEYLITEVCLKLLKRHNVTYLSVELILCKPELNIRRIRIDCAKLMSVLDSQLTRIQLN